MDLNPRRLIRRLVRAPAWLWHRALGMTGGSPCPACGRPSRLRRRRVLWPELIETWELDERWATWFDEREGRHCPLCGASLRARQLASGLLRVGDDLCGVQATSLAALCAHPRCADLRVAEINGAGRLHPFLARLPRLAYSEFGSQDPDVPAEDLLNLSYADETFDLVITSETLEHVPSVDGALREIRRILRPGGWHVFTVPVVWDRPRTRQRTHLVDGAWRHALAPSYHGRPEQRPDDLLVVYEFGADFVRRCQEAGFAVEVLRDPENLALSTFLTRRSSPAGRDDRGAVRHE
ncbi:MAG: class I SAM-dependent methyltransferase [Candidatus Krumholzibacteriia bacterium]